MKKLQNNIFVAVSAKVILLLLIYQISRFFFFLSNLKTFEEVNFSEYIGFAYHGTKFDLAAVLYVNILWLALQLLPFKFRTNPSYQKVLNYWFVITNSLVLFFEIVDYAYFPFTLQRSTSTILQFTDTEGNLASLIGGFAIEYWYAPLGYMALITLLVYSNKKIIIQDDIHFKTQWQWYLFNASVLAITIWLSIVAIRGGFFSNTRPMNNSFALKYVDRPIDVALVLNTPFSVIRTVGKKEVEKQNFYAEKMLNQLYPVEFYPPDSLHLKRKNVVIIILESFGKEYTGYFNRDKESYEGFTPFLDSLMTVSKNYVNAYANGKKSIDAIPSIIGSIPSIGNNYIRSHHATNKINALPTLLKDYGYQSVFYHGAPTGSMGFDAFCKHAGFDRYYGQEDYVENNEFEGNLWGIFDEEFFQYFANGLDQLEEPFLGTFFSLSSHGPYVVPEKHKGKFKKGPLDVHQLVHYTDYSLQQFFKTASKKPWFDNTLFVITADHTSIPYFKEYNNGHGHFMIPLVFYQKGMEQVGDKPQTAQQIDILPTILGELNYPKPYFAFGRDLNDSTQTHFAFNHFGYQKNYQFIVDEYQYVWNMENDVKALYNVKKDKLLTQNLIQEKPKVAAHLDSLIKAGLQQYNNRLLENRFTIKQ